MGERTCSVVGCDKPHDARGFCGQHYMTWRRHGDPTWRPPTVSQRFWSKVVESGDCWLWTGTGRRYGHFKIGGRDWLAHRFSYEDMVGPIPDGLTIDHLCTNKKCVNPDHLDPVPQVVNAHRRDAQHGRGHATTHCPQGHPYDDTNTRHRNGRRHCRACARERAQRNRDRKKVA